MGDEISEYGAAYPYLIDEVNSPSTDTLWTIIGLGGYYVLVDAMIVAPWMICSFGPYHYFDTIEANVDTVMQHEEDGIGDTDVV